MNAQAPHIAVLDPERIVAVCQSSFSNQGVSAYRGSVLSFSSGVRQTKMRRPKPTPPNTMTKIILKPIRPQRTPRSIIDCDGSSGSTYTRMRSPFE